MISIIVPVYNTSAYLEDCIQSILTQTFKEFELILVDNGSSDSSGEICKKFSMIDTRVTALHKTHGSISSARNLGLKYAKGRYIAFVDSDDLLEKEALQYLYTAAVDEKADIVSINAKRMYIDKIEEKKDSDKRWIYNEIDFLNAWLCEHKLGGEVWGKLFKADIVKDILFPEQRCEDMIYLFEAIKNSGKNVLLDRHLYLYRMHRYSSAASEYRRPVEDEKVDTFVKILNYIDHTYPQHFEQFFGAATNSIFGSVMRIYAAEKDMQQSVYLDNATAFLTKNKKRINNSQYISNKHKKLIKIYCGNKVIFKVMFRFRNKVIVE